MMSLFFCFAESEGFKPPIPERGIPDFESSAIDHSANSPIKRRQIELARFAERKESQTCLTLISFASAKVMHFYETTKIILVKVTQPVTFYSNESFSSRLFSCSASLLRMLSFISQVLSYVCSTMRGCISFTMRITSFISG